MGPGSINGVHGRSKNIHGFAQNGLMSPSIFRLETTKQTEMILNDFPDEQTLEFYGLA